MDTLFALIYWLIVALWLCVLATLIIHYLKNPRLFGTTRLLLAVVGIDTARNIIENIYFGLFFGGEHGLLPRGLAHFLGNPALLLIPKLLNIAAACLVLGVLLLRWLPGAVREREAAQHEAEHLQQLATTDPLTGLWNRRHFFDLAEVEWTRSKRHARPLSLLMVDIDLFKSINDHHGHDVGDEVLVRIAELCRMQRRGSDAVGRLGGEEFAVLLPETAADDAVAAAERLRQLVAGDAITLNGTEIRTSVSIGISDAYQASSLAELMKRADLALYEAKNQGRNRVSCFEAAPGNLRAI